MPWWFYEIYYYNWNQIWECLISKYYSKYFNYFCSISYLRTNLWKYLFLLREFTYTFQNLHSRKQTDCIRFHLVKCKVSYHIVKWDFSEGIFSPLAPIYKPTLHHYALKIEKNSKNRANICEFNLQAHCDLILLA